MARTAKGAGTIRKKTITRAGKTYTYWEARITTGVDLGTGRQKQRSFTGKTQDEVRRKMQAAAVEIDNREYLDPVRLSLAAWIDLWLRDYTGDKKYQTVKHYRAQCETHIKPALGAVQLAKLTAPMIQSFYNELGRTGRTVKKTDKHGRVTIMQQPLAAKSIRNIHGVLTKCLSTAVSVGYLRHNPADMVTLPRVSMPEIHPLTDQQVAKIFRTADHDVYGDIFRVILLTGLREAEAAGLTWDRIDFAAGTITVSQQLIKRPLADGGFTFGETKNGKARVLRPAGAVMDILREREREQIAQRLAAGEMWRGWNTQKERARGLVFTTALGEHLSPQTIYNHFKRIAEQIGAGDRCVHDLRHTYAVIALQNGDSVKTVQENLGHATASFTLDVYGHVSEKMRNDSAAKMDAYIGALAAEKNL